jgi:anti-sigma regulatory factor (Ser/Thr protein kinase)
MSRPHLPAESMRTYRDDDGPSDTDLRVPGNGYQRSISLPVGRDTQRRAADMGALACADWHLEPLRDDLAIALAELVQNAMRHATLAPIDARGVAHIRAIAVVLTHWPDERTLVALVRDRDPRPPVRRPLIDPSTLDLSDPNALAALEESGRGLHTVESVADAFGWYPIPPVGKAVWCSFVGRERGAPRRS